MYCPRPVNKREGIVKIKDISIGEIKRYDMAKTCKRDAFILSLTISTRLSPKTIPPVDHPQVNNDFSNEFSPRVLRPTYLKIKIEQTNENKDKTVIKKRYFSMIYILIAPIPKQTRIEVVILTKLSTSIFLGQILLIRNLIIKPLTTPVASIGISKNRILFKASFKRKLIPITNINKETIFKLGKKVLDS